MRCNDLYTVAGFYFDEMHFSRRDDREHKSHKSDSNQLIDRSRRFGVYSINRRVKAASNREILRGFLPCPTIFQIKIISKRRNIRISDK